MAATLDDAGCHVDPRGYHIRMAESAAGTVHTARSPVPEQTLEPGVVDSARARRQSETCPWRTRMVGRPADRAHVERRATVISRDYHRCAGGVCRERV